MKIYFVNGTTTMLLPLNPKELKTAEATKNRVASVVNLGDINIPDVRALNEIAFDGFFPAQWTNACSVSQKDLHTPLWYVNTIMGFKNSKKPVRLVMAGNMQQILKANGNTSCLFLIEDMQYEIKAGEEADIYYSIKLRQYRNFEPNTVTITKPKPTPQAPAPKPTVTTTPPHRPVENAVKLRTYVVQSGDSLWEIARRFYGDGSKYMIIANKNGISNPSLIHPGKILVIP